MNNIINLNRENRNGFLGGYVEAQNNRFIPEELYFVAGVILTVGLPEIFFTIYGGLIPFIVFGSIATAGAGLGWAFNRYRAPYQSLSLRKGPAPNVHASRNDRTKKAA
jgi:hypothetical protein